MNKSFDSNPRNLYVTSSVSSGSDSSTRGLSCRIYSIRGSDLNFCSKLNSTVRLIKRKNQRNSRIENSRIDLVCATKNIYSTIIIIWSRKFTQLNENRTTKCWKRSKKFLKQIYELEMQSSMLAETSKNN